MAPNPVINFNSIGECRTFLETLCIDFKLCPKYCHLQTNVANCSEHILDDCLGICCNQESVENYNIRVQEAINSINFNKQNFILKETGRTENEIGFALILNGTYKGFGYVETQQSEELENPEDYQFFVEPQKDNNDIQKIIASYLKKKVALAI